MMLFQVCDEPHLEQDSDPEFRQRLTSVLLTLMLLGIEELMLEFVFETIDRDETADYSSPDDSARDSSSDSSSNFHLDSSSDSSLRHLLSDHSSPDLSSTYVRPSRKRRRSPMTSVPALSSVSKALSPVHADLIPSPKRIRSPKSATDLEGCSEDSFEPYVPREVGLGVDVKDEISEQSRSREIDIEVDDDFERSDGMDIDPVEAVIEACTRDPNVVSDDRDTPPMVPEVIPKPAQEGAAGSTCETLGDLVQRIAGVESAVTALTERIAELERDNRRLRGTTSVKIAFSDDRSVRNSYFLYFEANVMKMPNTRSGASMTHEEVEELVTRRVAEEMEAREAAMNLEPLNENGDEQEGGNGGNGGNGNGGNGGNGNRGNGGNGNGGNGENGNGNRNGNHGMNYGGFMPVARECTFQDFLKCKPHNFSGTEGVVGLTRWFKKMETVFNISNCPPKYQVKYATCTLQDSALTWWISHKRTIGVDAAYAMNWTGLMRLMTEVYCPRNEIHKMETELFIGGLPDNIQGNVIAINPARLQDAICIANQLMDKKLQGYAARSAENKRRMESNPRDNHRQQPLFKRYHHVGPCTVKCNNCKRAGHQTRDCRSAAAVPNTQRAPLGNQQGVICYECGRPRHVKRECPRLRNQNHGNRVGNKTGNQIGGNEATTRAYTIGGGGTIPDSNVVTGTFLLNNCYASMLFDSGADRSFVSSTFSALIDVVPSTLDTSYAVELADGRISKTNVVLRGCTLGLLGHPFDIDLMPVELGSFDVIIGMDWLAKYHALIVCDEKVVRIPYGDEVLIIRGDNCDDGSKLNIISCTRTQKYIQKGCQVYLAQVTSKKAEDKSEEKRLEDVPIVHIRKSFQKNCLGYPKPTRQVLNFKTTLCPGAAPYHDTGRAFFDAEREGHSLRIPPTQGSREELYHARPRAWCSSVCPEDVETLSVRFDIIQERANGGRLIPSESKERSKHNEFGEPCGDPNHLIGECPKPPKDKNQRAFVGGSWSDSGEEDDEKAKDETCLIAQASNEICLRVDLEPDEWIKDSGCSKHMTGNRKLFSSYKAYNGGNVIFGSNLCGNIIGKGQICDNKCRVTFSEHDSEITKDGKVIGRGIRKKGLYVMKLGNKPKDKICLATIDENSTLWHRRLGHANMRLIQSLASKELVRNLPKLKFDQHFCDACKIGKNIVSTTRCLELLHMDLFGPSAVRSYGGNRYTLVIVDDYSRYTWTRFLKDKTEAFDQFEIFSKKIQNQLGCTIVSIRTDHGREFDNEVQFGEFCNANGITHNFSAPRTPQSNGVVERKNRTLQEMKPKNVNEALGDKSWIVAMQEELNQFFANDVWELVPQPRNMAIIGTKWIVRNKLDENVARLESIRILLACAHALDFKLFQLGCKKCIPERSYQ
ncbi:putative reverse transcriptase domain-containing protein [Tanacetum coccineum]